MASNRTAVQAHPAPLNRFLAFIFSVLICVAGSVLLIYGHQTVTNRLVGGIGADKTLIVLNEFFTHTVFGVVTLASALVVLATEFLVVYVVDRSRPRPGLVTRIQQWCIGGAVLGVVLALFGGILVNPYWHDRLEQAGYEQCSNKVFLLTESLTNSAWVKDERWCHDERLPDILRRHHNNAGFDRAARYLEAKYVNKASQR